MVGTLSQHSFGSSGNNSSETSPTSVSFPNIPSKYNITSSVSSASEYSSKSGVPKPVKAIAKFTSKSHLGSVTVKFHPPGFQTFKVTVTAEGKPIESQRLRRKAIKSFVGQVFSEVGSNYAINTQAEREDLKNPETNVSTPIYIHDHIIFPFRNTAQKKWIKSSIDDKSGIVEDVTKQPKRKNGGEGKRIRCEVSKGALSDEDFNRLKNKNLRARNLDILLRALMESDTADTRQTLQELPAVLQDAYKKIDVAMIKHHIESTSRPSAEFTVKLRSRMFLDITQSAIRFDYDLVPVVPAGPVVLVSELIKVVLGRTPVAEASSFIITDENNPDKKKDKEKADYLPMIKHMLCGLQVHCAYLPINGAQARRLSAVAYGQGRSFQIKDVRMPDAETEFNTDDGTRYTIGKYFNEVICPDRKLEHPGWPVVQDDRKAWIPLEMLYVTPDQILSRCGYLNERLISIARMYMKNHGEYRLCKDARGIYKQIAKTQIGKGKSGTNWLDDYTLSVEFTQNPDLFPNRKIFKAQKEKSNVALLRIDYKGDEDDDDSFFEQVQTDLGRKYFFLKYDSTENDILVGGKSINDIVGGIGQHDLILAVTSKSIKSTETIKQVFARLRSLCERDYGIMLVCQTGESLADLYTGHKDLEDCFPMALQRRINFMLGKPNFMSKSLGSVRSDLHEHFMIMGAHIMHKSSNEKKKTSYIPSIAAVVASTNGTALNFPGSARFQRTTAEVTDSGRVPQNSICDLEGMLLERFSAWNDKMNPPAYILFYRDSIEFDNAFVGQECETIRKVFVQQFSLMPLITYIVVNKNTELQYLPHGPDAPSAQLNQDFVVEQGKAKYRYYVACNDGNMPREYLQNLTRSINDSNQLYPQLDQVAKALPLTWAAKLCERVHGYVASVDPKDLPLTEIVRLKKPTQKEITAEDETMRKVKEYLKIDDSKARRLPWKKELDHKMFYL